MSLKQKIMQMALKRKMKSLPPDQAKVLGILIEKNPELLEKIGKEIKEKTKKGQDETLASMAVFYKYKGEISKLLK